MQISVLPGPEMEERFVLIIFPKTITIVINVFNNKIITIIINMFTNKVITIVMN